MTVTFPSRLAVPLTIRGRALLTASAMGLCWVILAAMPMRAQAQDPQVLTFDDVLARTLAKSRDVQLADLDMRISRERVGEEKADYYPQITGRFNTAYLYSIGNSQGQQGQQPAITVSAAGSNLIFSQRQYQSVPTLQAQLNIFDFGVRRRKVLSAKEDIGKFDQQKLENQRAAAIKALEAYEDALESYQNSQMQQQLLDWSREVVRLKQKLYEAGYTAKVEVAEAGYQVAKTLDDIESSRVKYGQALVDLGYLTKETYEPTLTSLNPIDETTVDDINLSPEQLPEYKRFEHDIAKKRMEVEISHRERWAPKITGFVTYTLYGSDKGSLYDAQRNLTARNLYIGLSAQVPVFEGFKHRHEANRLEFELDRLRVDQAKAVEETLYQLERAKRDTQLIESQQPLKEAVVTEANNKEVMLERLSQQQLVERAQVLTQAITRHRADIEARKIALQVRAAKKRQQLLTMGAS